MPTPLAGREPQFDREREFHDRWAAGTPSEDVHPEAAFENVTAPENRFILARMGDLRGRRVLDVGSGLGEAAVYFAARGAHVTATDISPEMCARCVEVARARGLQLDTVVTAAERLDVPPGSFDLVYGANVLH